MNAITHDKPGIKCTRHFPFIFGKATSRITMYKRADARDRLERMGFYVGTLLHEMIHAFLGPWGCAFPDCQKSWETMGKTGHGCVWQDIALALETAARDPNLLDLDVALNRDFALASELRKDGRRASREVCHGWDISCTKVERILRKHSDRMKRLLG